MAPIVQPPAQGTIRTFQNVLKRRIDTNRILKERERTMLSRDDYRMMEINLDNRANRNSGYKSYYREHTCNLATAIDSRVVELSSRLKGLELIDFRTGM